jgi:hypothetical protein
MTEKSDEQKALDWVKTAKLTIVGFVGPKQQLNALTGHFERKRERVRLRKKAQSDRWMGVSK